jgi:ABC-2 type transport system permease protein
MSVSPGDVLSVARRDFLDVRRAKLVWAPVALYSLFMVLFFWGQSNAQQPEFANTIRALGAVGGLLIIPLIALVAAYLSIAGERESGSIKVTLGQPIDRSAVVLGKLLSRTAVVYAGLLVSFVVGIGAAAVFVPEMTFEYGDYAVFAGLTMLFGLVYTSIAVAVSAATASRSRAMGAGIGFFFVFNVFWYFLPVSPTQVIQFLLEQLGEDPTEFTDLIQFVALLSPAGAYNSLVIEWVAPVPQQPGASAGGSTPWFLQDWMMLLILVAWLVVPLGLAYRRFRAAEIG